MLLRPFPAHTQWPGEKSSISPGARVRRISFIPLGVTPGFGPPCPDWTWIYCPCTKTTAVPVVARIPDRDHVVGKGRGRPPRGRSGPIAIVSPALSELFSGCVYALTLPS